MPSPDQITCVKQNLANMIDLVNLVNQYGQAKIITSFSLLAEKDSNDIGLQLGLNLLCGAFWAIGGEYGPVGSIAANFLAGCVAHFSNPEFTPSSLLVGFGSMYARFNQTCLETTKQLGVYYDDPDTYWNTTFEYNGQTITLGDLATIQFPPRATDEFQTFQDTCLFSLDQGVWQINLQRYCVVTTFMNTTHESMKRVNKQGGTSGVLKEFYSSKTGKGGYLYLVYNPGHKMQTEGYDYYTLRLGHKITPNNDGLLSDDAYNHIFKDTAPDTVTNPNGLWTREYVFGPINISYPFTAHINNLGIPAVNGSSF